MPSPETEYGKVGLLISRRRLFTGPNGYPPAAGWCDEVSRLLPGENRLHGAHLLREGDVAGKQLFAGVHAMHPRPQRVYQLHIRHTFLFIRSLLSEISV